MRFHEVRYNGIRIAILSRASLARRVINILSSDLYARSGFAIDSYPTDELGMQIARENREENERGKHDTNNSTNHEKLH